MNKRKILFILFVLLLISLLIYVVYGLKKGKPTPSPTPVTELNLLQVTPPEGKNESLFTATAIQFNFNLPVDISSAAINVSPSIDYSIDTKNNAYTLIIVPQENWKDNTEYTVVIDKTLSTKDKRQLNEDIIYKIEFEPPTNIIHY